LTVGTFWFYTRSLSLASSLDAFPEWSNRNYAWLARATWLVYPAITLVGLLAFIVRATLAKTLTRMWPSWSSRSEPVGILASLLIGNFFYCFFALFYLTFIERHRILELGYYADILIAPMFLALGSGILKVPKSTGARGFFT